MGASFKEKLDKLTFKINRLLDNRYIDLGLQFVDYALSSEGIVHETGRTSAVYGGVWDLIGGRYYGESESPHRISTWGSQLDYAVSRELITAYQAGRGTGKSRATANRLICIGLERPGNESLIMSDDYDKCKAIFEYIKKIMPWMMRKYLWQPQFKEMTLVTGNILIPVSGKTEGRARSKSANIGHVDEVQLCKSDRTDSFIASIREGQRPLVSLTGTMSKRMIEILDQLGLKKDSISDDILLYQDDPEKNPWLDKNVHRLRLAGMTSDAYRIEIKNDRELLEANLSDEHPRVLSCYGTDNLINLKTISWKDTTRQFTARKFKIPSDHICTYDPNRGYPNYAVIFKIFDNSILVAVDMILELGHCGQLALAIERRGYDPRKMVLIDDASATSQETYNKHSNLSPRKLMTDAGFRIYAESKRQVNPPRQDSAEHLHSLIAPAKGIAQFYVSTNLNSESYQVIKGKPYKGLHQDLQNYRWASSERDKFLKGCGTDVTHGPDCCRYAAWFCFPPLKRSDGATVIYTSNGPQRI